MPVKYITSKEKMKGKVLTGAAVLLLLGTIDKDKPEIIDIIFCVTAIVWGITCILDWRDRHAKR